jgi:glycerophosphoryl diester phosphodiesterase
MAGGRAWPLVLGHRGYRAKYPENTLLAFRRALECGADGIECDIQKSADGRFVVIHDPRVDRTSNGTGEVAQMRFDDLRRLDFGQGERILELAGLLAALPPDRWLDLELKAQTLAPSDCAAVEALLASRPGKRRIMISSFEASLLGHFRRKGYTVGFLVGDEIASQGIGALLGVILRVRPQYVNMPVQVVEKVGLAKARLLLRLVRLFGCSILLWTVNDAASVAGILRFARMVVTDEVEAILGAVRKEMQ